MLYKDAKKYAWVFLVQHGNPGFMCKSCVANLLLFLISKGSATLDMFCAQRNTKVFVITNHEFLVKSSWLQIVIFL